MEAQTGGCHEDVQRWGIVVEDCLIWVVDKSSAGVSPESVGSRFGHDGQGDGSVDLRTCGSPC